MDTLPDEIGELKELRWLNVRMENTLPDEIGELKELENASCGWKSCNIGRNEKLCENIDNLSHAHKTGVFRSTPVFQNMGVPFTLGFLQKQ